MKKFLSIFSFLFLLHAILLFGAEPSFICEPVEEWNALLDRSEGWLAGDGIYSFGADGSSKQGELDENSKTFFTFGDSILGAVNEDGSYKNGLVMVNHCMAVLSGAKPDPDKMKFLYAKDSNGRASNLFDRRYWLGDSIVIDSKIYTSGVVVDPKTWDMEGPWMLETPIENEKPVFEKTKSEKVELFHKDGTYEVLFGIGICDQGDEIYVYGVRDKKGELFYPRQLVVAKVPRKTYSDIGTWKFWSGERWSERIVDCNNDQAALAEGISNELSVTKMIGGTYDGKFVLIYTENCLGPNLNYAIAETPNSRFSKPVRFYVCPEPKLFEAEIKKSCGPKAEVVTYNAKAHPRLSKPGELLVSYNLNVFGIKEGMIFANKKYGFPRFVLLKLP